MRRGGRADDEVGDRQRLLDVALLHDLAADFVDDRLGRDRAPTGDQQARDAAGRQHPGSRPPDAAGADDQADLSVKSAERALAEPHGRAAHGDGVSTDAALRPDPAGHAERVVEQAAGHDGGGAGGIGLAEGGAHLAGDLGLADDHRFEAGRDAAEVADGVFALTHAGGGNDRFGSQAASAAEVLNGAPGAVLSV